MLEFKTIREGATGPLVTFLEDAMKKLGVINWEPKGVFTKELKAAVEKYQAARGLDADGVVGITATKGQTWPAILKELGGVEPSVPLPKPTGEKIPPFAHRMTERMKDRGPYRGGWPSGAIVHFTAGRPGAEKTIRYGITQGYTFWCLQDDGKLFCAHDADRWGYHAGTSSFPGLSGTVSDDLLGIEINAAGMVQKISDNKFKTWFGTYLTADEVRYSPGGRYPGDAKGYYHKYTDQQEHTLFETLLWLKAQRPDVFKFEFVRGHDEVAPRRKNDPGGALSMAMPELRRRLQDEWTKRGGKG